MQIADILVTGSNPVRGICQVNGKDKFCITNQNDAFLIGDEKFVSTIHETNQLKTDN